MNPRIMTGIFLLGVVLVAEQGIAADIGDSRYGSPSGKLEVAFEKPLPAHPADPDAASPALRARYIHYQIAVYRTGSKTATATAEYYDVYGTSDSPKPSSIPDLIKQMYWSPEEDFLILPLERWPEGSPGIVHQTSGGPVNVGPHERQIVNVSAALTWLVQPFPLNTDPLIWRDRYHVAGLKPDACAPNIYEFNGRNAKMTPVMPAVSPEGYVIEKVDAKRLLLRKTLGACATKSDQQRFRSECLQVDFSFGRKAIVKCP